MNSQVQIIKKDGKPEYAVVPFKDYQRLLELAEDAEDIAAADAARAELGRGEDELIPSEIARRLIDGREHPLKVWREYRGLTQEALAEQVESTKSHISQIEAGKKSGSVALIKRLAASLNVNMDDLVPR